MKFRRYFGWFPVQPCIWCGRLYWGGWPMFESGKCVWQAWMMEFCSKACAESEHEHIDHVMGGRNA